MSYFLKHTARLAWNVYLVQADSLEEAEQADGEYLGYFDDDLPENPAELEAVKTFGPFETEEDAKEDTLAWVEGQD